jgi:biotin-dependent carboxylase-like uncharacterized protein
VNALVVVEPGLASSLQDAGRPGYAHLGVPVSGAVDRSLAGLVNRLVGNDTAAALIETCGGLVLRAEQALLVATSAEVAPRSLRAGETITVPPGGDRLWQYVAVRGGVEVAPVLGSRATDTLSGLGPAPLARGDRLAVGLDPGTPIDTDHAPLRPLAERARIGAGPRIDWFATHALELLAGAIWTVTATSRVGVRLAGPAIERVVARELPSEALVRGAIQVPPDGNPVMMLADHPTTGGYPVLAVVHADDVVVVAHTFAGGRVRFRM